MKKVKKFNTGDLVEGMIEDAPGETRAEKVKNLKKEADTKNRLANPEANVIERMDSQGNPAKKTPAKPLERKPMNSTKTGGSGMGGSGVDIEGLKMNKNLKPKMASGGTVKSASSRADGCAIRGKTRA